MKFHDEAREALNRLFDSVSIESISRSREPVRVPCIGHPSCGLEHFEPGPVEVVEIVVLHPERPGLQPPISPDGD